MYCSRVHRIDSEMVYYINLENVLWLPVRWCKVSGELQIGSQFYSHSVEIGHVAHAELKKKNWGDLSYEPGGFLRVSSPPSVFVIIVWQIKDDDDSDDWFLQFNCNKHDNYLILYWFALRAWIPGGGGGRG